VSEFGDETGLNPNGPFRARTIPIGVSLVITWWAARRTHSRKEFYAAGGQLRGLQNGLAIAGDYTSAATFLGVTGLVYTSGFDGLIYAIGFLMAWPIILFLIAEPLRNLGRYTLGDVTSYRLAVLPIRSFATLSTLVIVICYLITQMVAAGSLVQTLFGIPYPLAVLIVGVLMTVYVSFGGMLATTWVQIVKAILLLSGSILMVAWICSRFGFSLESVFRTAVSVHPKHAAILAPGGLIKDPLSAVSLGIALIFGTAGLPHILMKFFTVPDAHQARNSVLVATGFIAFFYTLLFLLGFGAIAVLGSDPAVRDAVQKGSSNMVALYVANALGRPVLFGFISAVAFSTILAVVSGLTIAGASAVSHDLYAAILRGGQAKDKDEMLVLNLATCALGAVSVALVRLTL
jgi:cation/acetate symporter